MKYQNPRIPYWKTAMHRQLRYAVLATALFAGTAFAGARQELDTFTRGLKGLDGQFSQQVSDANGRVKESSMGGWHCRRRASSVGSTPSPTSS